MGAEKVAAWRYVLPNVITFAGMLLGLAAVLQAVAGRYEDAAWFVILCVLIDKLDGTAARLLGAQSDLGGQLDSFSDLVTFGIAPAALIYLALSQGAFADASAAGIWSTPVGQVGLAVLGGVYVVAACLRLAKFNLLSVEPTPARPQVFYGMPTTHAGGIVAAFTILALRYDAASVLAGAPALLAVLAVVMLVKAPLPKVVRRKTALANAFQLFNVVGAYVCGIFRLLPEYLALLLVCYALIGFAWGHIHRAELSAE